MRRYKSILRTKFSKGHHSLVPIRDEDKYAIRNWRNDQIKVLRQNDVLSIEAQEKYFSEVVSKLFEEEKPGQLLFSFLEDDKLAGYGGLVHINWPEKTAEVSFLTETSRSMDVSRFQQDWMDYLEILKEVSEDGLGFNSIFTYAYDIRPHLYPALESSGFRLTKKIPGAVEIDGQNYDVLIHTLQLDPLTIVMAGPEHLDLYFRWTNDEDVRANSFRSQVIPYDDHVRWFTAKVNDPSYGFYLFHNRAGEAVGQVRMSFDGSEHVIGVSTDAAQRGKGYGARMLKLACQRYWLKHPDALITAYIKEVNAASRAIFRKAGFIENESVNIEGFKSVKAIFRNEDN